MNCLQMSDRWRGAFYSRLVFSRPLSRPAALAIFIFAVGWEPTLADKSAESTTGETVHVQVVAPDAEGVLANVPGAGVVTIGADGRRTSAVAEKSGWFAVQVPAGDSVIEFSAPKYRSARVDVRYDSAKDLLHVRRNRNQPGGELSVIMENSVRGRGLLGRLEPGEPAEKLKKLTVKEPLLRPEHLLPPKGLADQLAPGRDSVPPVVAKHGPRPDLALTGIKTEIVKALNYYTGDLMVTATITNHGKADFDFPGAHLVIYRGPYVEDKSQLAKLPPGGSIERQVTRGLNFTPGVQPSGKIFVKIEYDKATKAPSKSHIDADFDNNEQSILRQAMALELENAYRLKYRNELLSLINQYRVQNGRQPLAMSEALNQSAQKHSEWMLTNGSKHSDFVNVGGETIYSGGLAPQDCFDGWKGSPPHNARMLNSEHKLIGIGQKRALITAQYQ